jgi:ubiquinone/menaquinone biosynthesis C-methylase UbiE
MNPNKALWEKGDFTRLAACMRASGEAVVDSLGVGPGMKVLDLACGDGTTALPSARRGAEVLGVDIARNLVEAGSRRAKEAGLANLRFQEGDACDLDGIPDDSFDLTMSMFGAMFAPRPYDVAKSMVRVTRPGGRIMMGNWIAGDPTVVAQILRISAAYTPPPPEGFISPVTWGVESHVLDRFGQAGVPAAGISCAKDTYVFEYDGTTAGYLDLFRNYYGPTMNAFEAAEKNGRADDLRRELIELFDSQNTSATGVRLPATFLRVTVTVP